MPFKKGDPRPPGAGRKLGSTNKATADIKALAQKHGPDAIAVLVDLAMQAAKVYRKDCPHCGELVEFEQERPEATRVAAVKELLDRGYGRAAQPHTGEGGEGPLVVQVIERPRNSDS